MRRFRREGFIEILKFSRLLPNIFLNVYMPVLKYGLLQEQPKPMIHTGFEVITLIVF